MKKKAILITGAGGTLGKAFTRYLRQDHTIIGVDSNEWAVAEFKNEFPDVTIKLKDFEKWKFHQTPVDLVIHCAAYKHVSLCEDNAHSCIENNITKTAKLFAEAYKYGADILFISTDKAVEPISTYGFSKAIGERLCNEYNGYVARLGNIIGSSGSVIPIWEKCIEDKEPIKLTDENMTRYMITDMEAVQQIWEGYKKGKKLIIPEMGEPKRILDILADVLLRHGYKEPADYKYGVETIGTKKGEKLNEKLKWEWE